MGAITIIDAPTSAGAYAPGQEAGPAALREAGLVERLREARVDVVEGGGCEPFRWAPDPGRPRAANAAAVASRAAAIADRVAAAAADRLTLVLGGDCTTGVGTVAGLLRRAPDAALLYVDRHADLHVPSSTDEGALDWMGVAHLLDIDGCEDGLAAIGGRRPILAPDRIAFLGLEPDQGAFQDQLIAAHRLPVVDVATLAAAPEAAAATALGSLPADAPLAVHFDCDVLDFLDAPLAENTARGLGPTLEAAGRALRTILGDPRTTALTVTEFNPGHGAADGSDARRLVDVVVGALARRSMRA